MSHLKQLQNKGDVVVPPTRVLQLVRLELLIFILNQLHLVTDLLHYCVELLLELLLDQNFGSFLLDLLSHRTHTNFYSTFYNSDN